MAELSGRGKLVKFCEAVQELKGTNTMKKGLSSNMTIKFDGSEVRFETEWPEEDDLRSFLLTFRQFVMPREDLFLDHIFNTCYQKLIDIKMKERLAEARKAWKKINKRSGLVILTHKGKTFTPREVVNLWLSGSYFHKDEEKRAVLKELPYSQLMMFKHQFMLFLLQATRIICHVEKNVEMALNNGLLRE